MTTRSAHCEARARMRRLALNAYLAELAGAQGPGRQTTQANVRRTAIAEGGRQ